MVDSQLNPDAAKNIFFAETFVFVFSSSAAALCQAAKLMMVYFLVHGQKSDISTLSLPIDGFGLNRHTHMFGKLSKQNSTI